MVDAENIRGSHCLRASAVLPVNAGSITDCFHSSWSSFWCRKDHYAGREPVHSTDSKLCAYMHDMDRHALIITMIPKSTLNRCWLTNRYSIDPSPPGLSPSWLSTLVVLDTSTMYFILYRIINSPSSLLRRRLIHSGRCRISLRSCCCRYKRPVFGLLFQLLFLRQVEHRSEQTLRANSLFDREALCFYLSPFVSWFLPFRRLLLSARH